MNFEIEDTSIPEIKIIHGKRFADERGYFAETYKINDFKLLGLPEFVQDNMSKSSKGVIRGLHWQEEPHGQGKLVQCIKGTILDVAVDIRKNSATYGQYVAVPLDDKNLKFLWVPTGFAHGFQALEDDTLVTYKVTNYWNSLSERSLRYSDPSIGITWNSIDEVVSEKDLGAPLFSEIY